MLVKIDQLYCILKPIFKRLTYSESQDIQRPTLFALGYAWTFPIL